MYSEDFVSFHKTWGRGTAIGMKKILKLKKPRIKAAGEKCQFARSCITFIRYAISEWGLKPQSKRLNGLNYWKLPQA